MMLIMEKKNEVIPEKSYPMSATVYEEGVYFCVFSKNCEEVGLLLSDKDRPFGKVKRVIFNYRKVKV